MPKQFRVFVHLEALGKLPKTGRRRTAVLNFIKSLPNAAELGGDFAVVDRESLRPLQVTSIAGFAITWWIDGPVDEVKVVDIRSVTE